MAKIFTKNHWIISTKTKLWWRITQWPIFLQNNLINHALIERRKKSGWLYGRCDYSVGTYYIYNGRKLTLLGKRVRMWNSRVWGWASPDLELASLSENQILQKNPRPRAGATRLLHTHFRAGGTKARRNSIWLGSIPHTFSPFFNESIMNKEINDVFSSTSVCWGPSAWISGDTKQDTGPALRELTAHCKDEEVKLNGPKCAGTIIIKAMATIYFASTLRAPATAPAPLPPYEWVWL